MLPTLHQSTRCACQVVLSGIKSVWGMPQVSDPGAVDGMAIQFLDVIVEPGLEVFAVLQQMADRAVP